MNWHGEAGEKESKAARECRERGAVGMLIHIGFGNIVNTDKIIAIVSPDSAPIKRLVQSAREQGMAIDATQGRRTKAVLVMEGSKVVLSALLPETIAGRVQAGQETDEPPMQG